MPRWPTTGWAQRYSRSCCAFICSSESTAACMALIVPQHIGPGQLSDYPQATRIVPAVPILCQGSPMTSACSCSAVSETLRSDDEAQLNPP